MVRNYMVYYGAREGVLRGGAYGVGSDGGGGGLLVRALRGSMEVRKKASCHSRTLSAKVGA